MVSIVVGKSEQLGNPGLFFVHCQPVDTGLCSVCVCVCKHLCKYSTSPTISDVSGWHSQGCLLITVVCETTEVSLTIRDSENDHMFTDTDVNMRQMDADFGQWVKCTW